MTELKLLEQYIQGTKRAEDITNVDELIVAVCGERKTGKSKLIADTCRKPSLHYDFDNRKESIAGAKDVIIKTIFDVGTDNPQAWAELESDTGSLENLKSKRQLEIKSIVLDSMTFLRQFAENQLMKDTSLFRERRIGTIRYKFAEGWDAVSGTQKMLQQVIRRLQALHIDVYCVFHTTAEKDKAKSTAKDPVYTERITVDPNYLTNLLNMFNETWRTYVSEDGKFMLQTKPDWKFQAATALKIDATEEQNITKMLEKHNNGSK